MAEQSRQIFATVHYDDKPKDCAILCGGLSSNPVWTEYIAKHEQECRARLIAIRDAVLVAGLEKTPASEICNKIWFSCSDDTCVAFTWRAWGDLLQAIHNKCEGYMKYYV